jgi:hypothetical protein
MPNPVDASTQGVKKKKKFWSDGQKRPKQVRHEERSHGKMKRSFGRIGAEGQKGRVLRMRRKILHLPEGSESGGLHDGVTYE